MTRSSPSLSSTSIPNIDRNSKLHIKASEIADLFVLENGFLQKAVDQYNIQALEGLAKHTERGLPMIPSYVSDTPTGKEVGTFLALDLGGTNFRVCSVELHGNSTYSIVQKKTTVPDSIMKSTLHEFINYLADRVQEFLNEYHASFLQECKKDSSHKPLKVGFTFSFPVNQTHINRGTLIRWTKGYDIKDAVGKDIPLALQQELDKRNLHVFIAAVVNDTVGTLMSRAYTKPSNCGDTVIGCIFGTGTNGAYSEPLVNITKFDRSAAPEVKSDEMIINTEWGSFDNDLKILPNNKYDNQVNLNTRNPGFHMFEKRVSGMFLGELLRLCMVDLHSQGLLFTSPEAKAELFTTEGNINNQSDLFTPWSMNTAVPAVFHSDNTPDLSPSAKHISRHLQFTPTLEELVSIQLIARSIGKRAAAMAAIPLAGAIIHTRALEKHEKVDIGADGSVVENYPYFQEMIREALAQTSLGPKGVERITLGIAKDGSGVGAALCALEAKEYH